MRVLHLAVLASVVAGCSSDQELTAPTGAAGFSATEASPNSLWDVQLLAREDRGMGVAIGPDRHPIVTMNSCVPATCHRFFRTIKYDKATGAQLWETDFDPSAGGFGSIPLALGVDRSGNAIAAGWTDVGGVHPPRWRVIKYAGQSGAILWNIVLDVGVGMAGSVAVDNQGSIYVAGSFNPTADQSPFDLRVIKLEGQTGAVVWTVIEPLEGGGTVSVGEDGNPVVAGGRVRKYNGASGAKVWETALRGGGRVAVGPSGDAFVMHFPTAGDLRVTRLDAASGAPIFTSPNVNTGGLVLEQAGGIAVGSDGNPVLTGRRFPPGSGFGVLTTLKLDGSTGSVIWSILDSDPQGGGLAVAVDADLNVVVTGEALPQSSIAARTVKYVVPLPTNQPPTAFACVAVNVPPLPPPCLQTQTSVSGPIPRPVTLDASGSGDPDGDVLIYTWREGARTLGEGDTPTLQLALDPGEHSITLTVTDGVLEVTTEVTVNIVKEVVVLVHGILGSSQEGASFGDLGLLLSRKFEVIGYDYRLLTTLCGTTSTPIEEIANDFTRWLHGDNALPLREAFPPNILGLRPINIVAHSMGGLVVASYMAGLSDPRLDIYQREFDRIVTLGTPFYGAKASALRRLEGAVCGLASLRFGEQERQMKLGSEFVWDLHSSWQERAPVVASKLLTVAGWGALLLGGRETDGIVSIWSAVRPLGEGSPASYPPCKHAPQLPVFRVCSLAAVPSAEPEPMLGIIEAFLNEGLANVGSRPPIQQSGEGLLLVRTERTNGQPFPGFEPDVELRIAGRTLRCGKLRGPSCDPNAETGALTIEGIPASEVGTDYRVTINNRPRGFAPVQSMQIVQMAAGRPSVVRFVFSPTRLTGVEFGRLPRFGLSGSVKSREPDEAIVPSLSYPAFPEGM